MCVCEKEMQQTLYPNGGITDGTNATRITVGEKKHVQISVVLASAPTSWCTEERRRFLFLLLLSFFYLTSFFSSLSQLESHKGSTFGQYLRRLCNIFNYWTSHGVEELSLSNKSHNILYLFLAINVQ